MSSSSVRCLGPIGQNRIVPAMITTETIFESQGFVEQEDCYNVGIQYSIPPSLTCRSSSKKASTQPTSTSNRCNNKNNNTRQAGNTNTQGCDSVFESLKSESTECSKQWQTAVRNSNDKLDYNVRTQPKDKQTTRTFFQRPTLKRPSLFANIRRKDILFGDVIGKGGFGKVHTGQVHGRAVAVKVVQKRRGSGIHREVLQAERLAFSLNLRHDNIVNILAVNLCDGMRGDALIVMELVSPQTLQNLLDDNNRTLTQSQRLTFALQITNALNYLHENDVAHLDVKPRNVLMTHGNTCKLADFGSLTRTRQDIPREETEFTQLLGTLPYRAPELMKGCFPTNKADIFSLGITLWQMVTRETPHCGANPHWLIYQVTKVNKRPDYHETGSDTVEIKYRDLYDACWDAEPELRPDASDVIVSLSALLQCVWDGGWSEVLKRNE